MTKQEPAILMAQGRLGHSEWRQYFVITDRRCAIVDMEPAYFGGWKFKRVTIQGAESWGNYSRDLIVQWKRENSQPISDAGDLGEFREKLLMVAHNGTLEDSQ